MRSLYRDKSVILQFPLSLVIYVFICLHHSWNGVGCIISFLLYWFVCLFFCHCKITACVSDNKLVLYLILYTRQCTEYYFLSFDIFIKYLMVVCCLLTTTFFWIFLFIKISICNSYIIRNNIVVPVYLVVRGHLLLSCSLFRWSVYIVKQLDRQMEYYQFQPNNRLVLLFTIAIYLFVCVFTDHS